eukprot:TRINITY_DN4311_c0_g1_i1.p1 TRINITY_DN4311_c0_g1~~TRINITY_DN4311_c0_g1_i1.p1  ORF type:complete len:388 (-),score=50.24 TRINITY_DN4311_c0_g1_i1:178-1341(-)
MCFFRSFSMAAAIAVVSFPLALGIAARHSSGPGRRLDASVSGFADRMAVMQCSLRQHASAELSALRSALEPGSASPACSNSMDVGGKGTVYLSMLQDKQPFGSPHRSVWVSGFPRSSTSTVLSMISAGQTVADAVDESDLTYSLFEPCHGGDEYEGELETRGCGGFIWHLTRCDFNGVKNLWGWMDPHSTRNHSKQDRFTREAASALCAKSQMVAFKTVDNGHKLPEWKWLLDDTPTLRVIDVVRDPRGIYASWKTLEPFATLVKKGQFYTIKDVCSSFEQNMDFGHGNVKHVVFEEMVKNPEETMKNIYDWLGMKFGNQQAAWLKSTFDASDCPEPKPWEVGFTDCHTNSRAVAEKWRWVLSPEELQVFNQTESCRRVMDRYGYTW